MEKGHQVLVWMLLSLSASCLHTAVSVLTFLTELTDLQLGAKISPCRACGLCHQTGIGLVKWSMLKLQESQRFRMAGGGLPSLHVPACPCYVQLSGTPGDCWKSGHRCKHKESLLYEYRPGSQPSLFRRVEMRHSCLGVRVSMGE